MLEKQKLLILSNFSFSHSVFKRLVQQTCKSQDLFGEGLKEKIDTYLAMKMKNLKSWYQKSQILLLQCFCCWGNYAVIKQIRSQIRLHVLRTLWEQEKNADASIFSFSYYAFYSFDSKFIDLSKIRFDI